MQQIGEYLVQRLVGEGGMGRVYEAEERLSKRRVALKVLRSELARSEAGRRLFLNEMQILAQLDHPNVVRCLACAEFDEELVMVLEFLDGQTLRERLTEQGPMSWPEAIDIVGQIAAGLQIAHNQSPPIVHRDLKPENIMVMPDGRIKVMDFGIAKVMEALGSTTTHSVGTLQYMSPEQIDAGHVDVRSDLYSLGLIFYELLAGRPPFESASPRELLNLQCTAEPPPLPDAVRVLLPAGLARLLKLLLAKRPDERPTSVEAVIDVLSAFQVEPDHEDVPSVTAHRPLEASYDTIGVVERARKPSSIDVPLRVAVAVMLGLSAIAGAITYRVKISQADVVPSVEHGR